jgi:hypothetical protein
MFKVFVCIAGLLSLAPSLLAQASYTATRLASLQVGVAGSSFTLDDGSGHEEGFAVYGDLDVTRHWGLEGIYRNASIQTPHDIGENHLLAGPRYHITHGRFQPYAKALFGLGTINIQFGHDASAAQYSEHYFIYGFGGGVDFRATRHIVVRPIDFEYQLWPGFAPHGLTPYGYTAGVAYRF